MIDQDIVRKLAEAYLRNCESGMGEADCWRFAIESVEDDLSQEKLASFAKACSRRTASYAIRRR